MVQKYQPLPPREPEINWELKTTRITQSIFITLSVEEMWLEIDKLEPTNSFLNDLKIARSLQFKFLKYEYFKMMIKKYGFLFWQEPSLDLGSFLEFEVDLVYENEVDLKEAIRTLKTMWKNHMWKFLKDFKVFPERRLSKQVLEEMLSDSGNDGDGYQFFKRFKAINGQKPKITKFDQIFSQLKMPSDLVFVRSNNREWEINSDQFVFNFGVKANQNGLNESYLTKTILNGGAFFIF